MITQNSIEKFLDDLASAAPTPGGGSAAAVMGATGAALVSMVCNVTLGKKGQEAVASEMRAILEESEQLRAKLTVMATDDIAAFDGLMAAYRMPKSSEQEKMQRTAAIQDGLLAATRAPMECARACAQVIALAARAGQHGYSGVISDAGVGVLAAHAALRSAALNVYINAPALQDRDFAAQSLRELEMLSGHGVSDSEAVMALVRSRLG
jgi:methenyltetrahydrofolate cyclohydrolase